MDNNSEDGTKFWSLTKEEVYKLVSGGEDGLNDEQVAQRLEKYGANSLRETSQKTSFLLFSLALAVGLTPQLLPTIISVNLSAGARRMATKKVIVKRLSSIENMGSMDILCSDKSGTVTEGHVNLKDTLDSSGVHSDKVLEYAWLNAS